MCSNYSKIRFRIIGSCAFHGALADRQLLFKQLKFILSVRQSHLCTLAGRTLCTGWEATSYQFQFCSKNSSIPNPVEPEPNRGRKKADALPKVPSAAKHLLYRMIAISLPPSFEGGRLLFLLLKSFAATAGPIKSVAK